MSKLEKGWVAVVGAGAVLQEKFTPDVLDKLGPSEKRVILDIDLARLLDEETRARSSNLVVADGEQVALRNLENCICVVTTPEHLGVIKSLVEAGAENFIVEKPLVNNQGEVDQLQGILSENPDVKIYPLDFYVQKVAPLLVLTGAIKPDDPRFNWVVDGQENQISHDLCGSLDRHVGKIEGIDVVVFEGGSLGLPDLDKRKWLEEDPVRGGMLLDLGTHALAPLFAAGVLLRGEVVVDSAIREVFGNDRLSFIKANSGQAEMRASALLTAVIDNRRVPVLLSVGKTFQDGGVWKLVIRGERGDVSFGLRTGQRLTVEPKEGQAFQLKLRVQDPYGMAFQEAKMFFESYPDFDGNFGAMLSAIEVIDTIKAVSNR